MKRGRGKIDLKDHEVRLYIVLIKISSIAWSLSSIGYLVLRTN